MDGTQETSRVNTPVEYALGQVMPGRLETYEALLRALADGQVWMLLWHGQPGSADAQYGNVEHEGYDYAPCVTSQRELTASGWSRAHEVVSGRGIAAELFQGRYGLWLNPHAAGGGVGIPWLDLRRTALGLDRLPPGPLRITEPAMLMGRFYAELAQHAHHTPAVRSLRGAWVEPALGEAYLAVGLDLYDTRPESVEAVRALLQRSVGAAPGGVPLSTVAMADAYDPVAMWMRACARPFFDRESARGAVAVTPPAPAVTPPPGPWIPFLC